MTNSKKMFIYSGDCRLCECGITTNLFDVYGNSIFTGDIVMLISRDEISGANPCKDLTAAVSDQYETKLGWNGEYWGSHHFEKPTPESFIVGIKGVDIPSDKWEVLRLKSHKDAIHGEHWTAYGFNYRLEEV